MHMADALLSPPVAVAMYVASGVTAGLSIKKMQKDDSVAKLPTMAVTSALVFAGQMVNYTIPGTGASGHLCGGMLLSALLGPQAGFLSMVVILTIQCLLFADGGLLALGANCWNMAFYGCFVGYYALWRPIMKSRLYGSKPPQKAGRRKIILASVLGCVLTLQLGAFSVVLETYLSDITELPLKIFAGIMQPIHLVIGLVEGLITAAVLLFIYEARPALLMNVNTDTIRYEGRSSLKTTLTVLVLLTIVAGGGLSLLSSSNPDGLEWSLFGNAEMGYGENMGLQEDNYGISSEISDAAEQIQGTTALLSEYAFPENDSAVGTSISGLIGSAIVAVIAVLICVVGGFFRKKMPNASKTRPKD